MLNFSYQYVCAKFLINTSYASVRIYVHVLLPHCECFCSLKDVKIKTLLASRKQHKFGINGEHIGIYCVKKPKQLLLCGTDAAIGITSVMH